MSAAFDPLALLEAYDPELLALEADAVECERDLALFFRRAWPSFDPAPYVHGWHIDAIADHLMAVTDGEIKQLLINIPYRSSKTALVSVAYPAWTWAQRQKGPRAGPQVKFLCLTYASKLALDNATTSLRLIKSPWYQDRWGHRVKLAHDQESKEKFDTTAGGSRINVGFEGSTLGRGGDIKIIDDPHKVDDGEEVMASTIQTYTESLTSRFTDPESAAEIIIMQRLSQADLSAHVIDRGQAVHLMLPMEYDPMRHCVTVLGWQDPRGLDDKTGEVADGIDGDHIIPGSPMAKREGALLWPARFKPDWLSAEKVKLGPYAAAGQLQQSPTPRGGGLVKREWWRLWPGDDFPDFIYTLVAMDTASTEKEQNDESGLTTWGVFLSESGLPQVMLINGWEGRIEFDPLVQKGAEFAKKHKADVLLIEAKANGIAVAQEVRRRYGTREWATIQYDPKGDKVARLLSVQPQWSGELTKVALKDPKTGHVRVEDRWVGGIIWAPDRDFAELVIERVGAFPKGRHKGIVDTASMAIKFMRDQGILRTREEHEEERTEERRYKKPGRPRYDV